MTGSRASNPGSFFTPVLLLLFANLALFHSFLSPSSPSVLSQNGGDLSGQFFWWRQFGFDELRKGHLALWNDKLFCGQPFFGGFQSALLYPPNWLFMALPLPFAINLSILLHTFLGGAFTYGWVRSRGSHWASALLAGFAFMWGAAYILHIVPGHLPNLCTMAWVPLVFWAVDLYLKEQKAQWLMLGMAALALQVFSGHIQYVYYTGLLTFVYARFHLPEGKKIKVLGGLALLYIGAMLLSAVQLLAGWDAVSESARSTQLDIDYLDSSDITPERLWCLLLPNFFGKLSSYWGGGLYAEGAVFIGVTTFVLALAAFWVSRNPQKKFFGWLALFLTILGVGKRTPLFAVFCHYFPFFAQFRGIGKLNIFISLCLILLAAMGMDEFLERKEVRQKMAGWLFKVFCFLVFLTLFFWGAMYWQNGRLFKNFISHSGEMTVSVLMGAVTLGLLWLMAWTSEKRPWLRYGFFVLAVLELAIYAAPNVVSFNSDVLRQEVSVIDQTYQKDPGDYRVVTDYQGSEPYWANKNDVMGTKGLGAWGDDPCLPGRYARFTQLTHYALLDYSNSEGRVKTPIAALGLTRLKYVFHEKDGVLTPEKLKLNPMPRAVLMSHWESAPLENIWPKLLEPQFDPKKTVWLESPAPFASVTGQPKGKVTLKDLDSDEVEIEAQVEKPCLLVMSDNYSHGWQAFGYADSAQATYPVLPANGFMRAIPLSAGKHHILLQYRPRLFVIGCWVSWVAWFIFIATFFLTIPLVRRPARPIMKPL